MNSFHDQIFSEIDATRKLAAEFADRYGRKPDESPHRPSETDRLAQEAAAAAEIADLAAEEERLARQARERAEHRAKAREEEKTKSEEIRDASPAPAAAEFKWNAMAILKALAKLRVRERSAAEELIRRAREVGVNETDEPQGGPEQPAAPIRGMWTPSQGASQVWYFTSSGTRCGPVTFAELRTMAASRVLDPRLDMVWKDGMDGWKQAGLLDGLFERRSVPTETPDRHRGKKNRMIAALPTDLTAALASKHMRWPGAGRRSLWLGLLLIPVLWSQLLWWSTPTLITTFGGAFMSSLLPFASLVPAAVLIHLVLMRLVNLGMSRWWALVLAIPVLNLWVVYRCLVCPSGYAHHRKLDRSGMAIALVIVVIAPAVCYINLKHPGLLSPAQALPALQNLIERAGRTIFAQ
jgi:hypothetical protein